MKNALVLGGGGSKGSYQVGAIKALKEFNVNFDYVAGTSIGALNGCLVVQNDYEYMYHLWDNISIKDIIIGDFDKDFAIENIISNIDEVKNIYIQLRKNKVDISPFISLVNRSFDIKKFSNSKIKYEAIATALPRFSQASFNNNDMIKLGTECLLASSACFPAFPIAKIDNNHYIDGGYTDNLPITAILKYNPDNIYVIDIDYTVTHKSFKKVSNVTYIHPKESIGSIFNFDREKIKKNIQLGYNDVYKYYGKYKGFKYTFLPYKCHNTINDIYSIFLNFGYELIEFYANELDIVYTKEDIFYKSLDDLLNIMNFKSELVYDVNTIIDDIHYAFKYHINTKENINYKDYADAFIKQVIHSSDLESLILLVNINYNNKGSDSIIKDIRLKYLAKVIVYLINR